MKFTAITMCKNESDIIERYIRINSKFIDTFYIVDDNSSDDTLQILSSLKEEGFDIVIAKIQDKNWSREYQQSSIMTSLLHSVDYCDYIFTLDIDEFIFTPKETIENLLTEHTETGVEKYFRLRWSTFVPLYLELTPKHKLKDIFLPVEREQYRECKCVIPYYLRTDVGLGIGNHMVTKNISWSLIEEIPICHFPVRSANQILVKALTIDHKFSIKKNKSKLEGYHIRNIANIIRQNNYVITQEMLKNFSLSYLGSKLPEKFKENKEFMNFEEEECKYTPPTYPVIRILDNFIGEMIS